MRGLLTNRNFILLVMYFTLPAIAGWIVRDWMPEILRERFHLGQGRAGVSAILFVQIASLVGAVVGGTLADRWMRRTSRGRIYTSAIGMALFLPALFSVGNSGTLGVAIAGLDRVRARLGLLRQQQHADPQPDRAAGVARDGVRDHEPGEHQLWRLRGLGVRGVAGSGCAAESDLRGVCRGGVAVGGDRVDDSAAE